MIRPRRLWEYVRHGNPTERMTSNADLFPMAWWSAWASAWFTMLLGVTYVTLPAVTNLPGLSRDAWGVVWLVTGAALALALRSSLSTARVLLRVNGSVYLFYGALYGWSAGQPALGVGASLLFGYVALHHYAAAQVLRVREEWGP